MITDILFDETGEDLLFVNGDLVIGESTEQHINDLMRGYKGDFRFAPQLGVGINTLLLDEIDEQEVKRLVRSELQRDGLTVETVTIENGLLNVKANY